VLKNFDAVREEEDVVIFEMEQPQILKWVCPVYSQW